MHGYRNISFKNEPASGPSPVRVKEIMKSLPPERGHPAQATPEQFELAGRPGLEEDRLQWPVFP